MAGVLAKLLIKLGLDKKEFDSGIDGAKKKTNAFGSAVKKMGGLLAGAFAVDRLIAFGKELLTLGGIAEGVENAFNRIADSKTLLDLQDATKGTVSELELMKRAVSAQNLGLPVENLAKLFEFATKRAQDTGESVDFLVNSIVLGIGRKSPLILDNLGISAIQLRGKLKGVGMETASVADVAAAVGEIAAESMRNSGEIIDTNAIKVQQLAASWENFKKTLATDSSVQTFMSRLLMEAQDFINLTTKFQTTKQVEEDEAAKRKAADSAADRKKAEIELNNLLGISINDLSNEEIEAAIKSSEASNEAFEIAKKNGKLISEIKSETEALTKSLDNYGVNQKAEIQNTLAQIDANKKLIKSLTTLITTRDKQAEMPAMQSITDVGRFGQDVELPELEAEKLAGFGQEQLDKAAELQYEAAANFIAFKEDVALSVMAFGTDVVEEFGSAMGEFARSGEFPEDFGSNVLSIIGKFISGLGKQLIALGIASEAFQLLLDSAFSNPYSAAATIAAGAVLVALGGAIGGYAKAGPTGSGVSGSGGASISSQPYTAVNAYVGQGQSQTIELNAVLKGDSIFLSNERNTFKRGVIG